MEGTVRPGEIEIGRALVQARAEAGLELADAEARTKIRARYLQALEEERWDELPSDAYAKGFLRTYAGALALDAELLVDEYRRQVEAARDREAGPSAERVLEARRRPGERERRPSPAVAVLALITLAAVVTAVIALTGGESEPTPGAGAGAGRKGPHDEPRRDRARSGELIRLELRVRKPVEVCLLGAGRQELIDGQLLSAGSRDAFASERFQLRFPAGFERDQVALKLNGKRAKLPAVDGPARLRIAPPARVRQASAPGESCP